MKILDIVRDLSKVLDRVASDRKEEVRTSNMKVKSKPLVTFLFIVVSLFAYILVFIFLLVAAFARTFFHALIIYRGFRFRIKVPFFDKMKNLLIVMGYALKFPNLHTLLYPIIQLYSILADINIGFSFSSLGVTCQGAVATTQLFLNIVILGMVIIVIEAEYESLLVVSVRDLIQRKFTNSVLRDKLFNYTSKKLPLGMHTCIATVVSCFLLVNPIQSLLQYSISLVEVGAFFPHHTTTEGCNSVRGAHNFDAALAALSTTFFYLLILPVIYTGARIISPRKAKSVNILQTKEVTPNKKVEKASRISLVASRVSQERVQIQLNEDDDAVTMKYRLLYFYQCIWRFISIDVIILKVVSTWLNTLKNSLTEQDKIRQEVPPQQLENLEHQEKQLWYVYTIILVIYHNH